MSEGKIGIVCKNKKISVVCDVLKLNFDDLISVAGNIGAIHSQVNNRINQMLRENGNN